MNVYTTSLGFVRLGIAAGCMVCGAAQANASAATNVRLDELMWRQVQNRQGETLGSVSDVLVQMPSGRVVFVAIDPAELFQRPKVVPPGALVVTDDPKQPVQLDITLDRWLSAPLLDWNAELVIKNTEQGSRIYAFYQQAWQEPDPQPPWRGALVVQAQDRRPEARYVSLKNLLFEQVLTRAGEQVGYVRDFIVDWPAKRATHALVSPHFTPAAGAVETWYAIPAPLLSPSLDSEALTVNSSIAAFRRAEALPKSLAMPEGRAMEIYRWSPPTR